MLLSMCNTETHGIDLMSLCTSSDASNTDLEDGAVLLGVRILLRHAGAAAQRGRHALPGRCPGGRRLGGAQRAAQHRQHEVQKGLLQTDSPSMGS